MKLRVILLNVDIPTQIRVIRCHVFPQTTVGWKVLENDGRRLALRVAWRKQFPFSPSRNVRSIRPPQTHDYNRLFAIRRRRNTQKVKRNPWLVKTVLNAFGKHRSPARYRQYKKNKNTLISSSWHTFQISIKSLFAHKVRIKHTEYTSSTDILKIITIDDKINQT